ncbi:MAG: hypBA [Verrucomicrobiales bacterium]|nr:hypBA [Verrucomicrobiales bacterium]
MVLEKIAKAELRFGGVVGERIRANVDQWLLPAPGANPGILEMFRQRDRLPVPQLVPWAGEFAGKYLISCVQAIQQTGRDDLRAHTAGFVRELLSVQAEDGYLGPFPKAKRLLGEWDLWGHYHVMQGLLAWHDLTGEAAALDGARKAADLIVTKYGGGGMRVLEAGSPEMNMAVSHVMAELFRRTGDNRYWEVVMRIEKDWEKSGDYLRTGVAKVPFYRTPLPRWESLHDLQALVEMWRITGNPEYREAFINHWRSIRELDVRNSGAFSGGEQATGNAYAPTAIETCCTVAWMALSVDMLALTGEAAAADELERSTLNGALGAQHPSGRWWTYSTPMDGERRASAHEIVFQARAGTPELNCCSVNGPRAPGMLTDWAVMRRDGVLTLNWHGPMTYSAPGLTGSLTCQGNYPMDGKVTWRIGSAGPLKLRFRVPGWAVGATAGVGGENVNLTPGTYFEIDRTWQAGEKVEFHFPMPLRAEAGAREQAGRVSVHRGPLLLAWDQQDNAHDGHAVPRLDAAALAAGKVVESGGRDAWILVEVPGAGGVVKLRDFATAGSRGTRYRSWLPTVITAKKPADGKLLLEVFSKPPVGSADGGWEKLEAAGGLDRVDGAVRLNGRDQMLKGGLPAGFPEEATVSLRIRLPAVTNAAEGGGSLTKKPGQVFSAWCGTGDDPLRIVVQDGLLSVRCEAGPAGAATGGVPLAAGEWHRVMAVKSHGLLALWVDGQPVATAALPAGSATRSRTFALGGNPMYAGSPEFLAMEISDFQLYSGALEESEMLWLAERR